ncbi:MAG: cbb3-type cytochrome oxidase assembly protein CcoS [Gammaproteobacteria bacterium]
MEITYILILLSLIFIVIAAFAFYWAIKSKQFDNLEVEASRILFEEKKDE